VVASDWDGYRDLVEDDRTGFLVPTAMVAGATANTTARLLTGELSYDYFLAECSQATAVDIPAMAEALSQLASDAALRLRMGAAGCARARELFAWPKIISAFEDLWQSQNAERSARSERSRHKGGGARWRGSAGPAFYPPPEKAFAGYPSRFLGAADRLVAVPGGDGLIDELLTMPLVNHAPEPRVSDRELIRAALALAPCSIGDFDRYWLEAGVDPERGRATLAWMLKYGLLRAEIEQRPTDGRSQ
jgi:hypothetical protein